MESDLDELNVSSDMTETLRTLLTNDNFEELSDDDESEGQKSDANSGGEKSDSDEESEALPDHVFDIQESITKSGKKKGTSVTRVSLSTLNR